MKDVELIHELYRHAVAAELLLPAELHFAASDRIERAQKDGKLPATGEGADGDQCECGKPCKPDSDWCGTCKG